jgi:phosphatidylinositol alpha 1,6-mannosyltransferase
MRVAIVTESFLPQRNGVTSTVVNLLDRLLRTGHEPLVVAPAPGPSHYHGVPVARVRSMPLPAYRSFPLGLPDGSVVRELRRFRPDVVHLASPVVLGAAGLRAARRLDVPTVAAYQTDLAGFARQYGLRAEAVAARWLGGIHRHATRTLAPSRSSCAQLHTMGVGSPHLWRPGVDLDLFRPGRRDAGLHALWAGSDRRGGPRVVVGYVGRLAHEKRVRRLAEVARIPGTRLVVVGDGPGRGWLERNVPEIELTGTLHGPDLARAFASLDVFVHTGEAETFCETVQEAQASGVPVVAAAAGGQLDLVTDGRTGLLYDPTEERSLRRTVATLVGDELLRDRVAGKALAAVAGHTWVDAVDELVARHYLPLAGRAPAPAAA